MPSREQLERSRWLRWLGPALHHPRLWHASRRGLALGVALGVFFGLLMPLAQIPFSAAAAVALRANVPVAVASTLVTNPATFGPIYYAAWRVGSALLGEEGPPPGELPCRKHRGAAGPLPDEGWFGQAMRRIAVVGKPLLLGLSIFAVSLGALSYWSCRGSGRCACGCGAGAGSPRAPAGRSGIEARASHRHRVVQRHPPAVHHHDLAGDVAGGVAGQPGDDVGDLRRARPGASSACGS